MLRLECIVSYITHNTFYKLKLVTDYLMYLNFHIY